MSQGNIFVYIQKCHNQYWLDKLCILFDNSLVKDSYATIFIMAVAVFNPRFIRVVV